MNPAIHLFGLPTDINSSFERGAAAGPAAIRAALWSERGNLSSESGLEIGADVALTDDGDLPLTENTPRDDAAIAAHVAAIIASGGVPLALGGDHAVSFPLVQAVAAAHGPVSILHFDAHPDLYDDFEGNPRSHASPFARIMERGLAKRLVQVGIRTLTRHCAEQADRFGIVETEHRDGGFIAGAHVAARLDLVPATRAARLARGLGGADHLGAEPQITELLGGVARLLVDGGDEGGDAEERLVAGRLGSLG